jgi:FtsP/CotA-like multicopper oxidase with cupredoxin domain
MYLTRRDFVKLSAAAGAGAALPLWARRGWAEALAAGLSDPTMQPKFAYLVPNALDPGFMYSPDKKGRYKITVSEGSTRTGLVNKKGRLLKTDIFGYKDGRGSNTVTWPGRTFQVVSGSHGGETRVRWQNDLPNYHLLPVDTSLHWAYSLQGYDQYSIEQNGVPIITHVHGGHSKFQFDGNPEFFYNPGATITGPQWNNVPGGFTMDFRYDNEVPAGNLWYHDHALGITRLNVYAGMAGFFFVRDGFDTGQPGNEAGLPAWPHEMALAIQDRMFTSKGSLFYPAFPGDPAYADFITGEGAVLPPDLFPGGGPTALAEFFGDHMVVNGVIWPKADVDRTLYRLRLLNGCDSRFLVIQFRAVELDETDLNNAGSPIDFQVIGSDQGLGTPQTTDTLVFEPGGRYDVLIDFGDADLDGKRVVMANIGGDAPFGGDFGSDLPPEDFFGTPDDPRATDRIMAFDVVGSQVNSPTPQLGSYGGVPAATAPVRKVALFEGKDEFGRLQPLLGRFNEEAGPNEKWEAIAWHSPTTEQPVVDTIEEWEIHNFTGDAHPIHLHLVNFEILNRQEIAFEVLDEEGQQVVQHNGTFGTAPSIADEVALGDVVDPSGYAEAAPKDMVTALPEQVTRIRAKFDRRGRYVWHCHILSHEDHEMMRVLEVVED